VRADALACVIWGNYTVLLGYIGGKAFEDAPWKGLLIAFALALSIAGGVELVRHRRSANAGSGG
jgi:membrane protein DedA with SNARE-associated domain